MILLHHMSFNPVNKTHTVQLRRKIKVPVQRLYKALIEKNDRKHWALIEEGMNPELGERCDFGSSLQAEFTEIKPLEFWRMDWTNPRHKPGSSVVIQFSKDSKWECTVYLRHWRIRTKKDFDDLNSSWIKALDSLKEYLEKGQYALMEQEISNESNF